NDDANRLVYADWLDERGDERGRYLRAEVEIAGLPEGDPRHPALEQELRLQRPALPADWVAFVGKRYDLWLHSYDRTRKLAVIRVRGELPGGGLAEAKSLSEALPARVRVAVPRAEAERGRDALREAADLGLGSAEIRPTGSEVRLPPPPHLHGPGYHLVLRS